ncbi:Ankyrin repeats (3 copies) [Pirellulimonas nuda]|uniref:Ankyrin repeats (3 copies) n=1 Tax=Pirellulimonas nuda TaxID=2528009 RepID=A0A518DF94_9BACT|nr:ankyrin repeat domain-containing protein [Pirellulimonas nuda]QDU90128.1 Ankyrin repeats (3 copies) [Pirellulimonas nuda]
MRPIRQAITLAALISVNALGGCSGGGSFSEPANRLNSSELMTAAAKAHGAGRTEDAGFLFLAGQARYQIDKTVFPPVGQAGESPGVLKAALSATIGQSIQPALANDPVAFANAVARFAEWSPEFGEGYDPGWEYTNRLGDKEAMAVVKAAIQPILAAGQSKARLLKDDEYVRLANVIREAGAVERQYRDALQRDAGRISEAQREKYREAMARKNAAAERIKEIEFETNPETRWHASAGWKPADYFDDPQVVDLCTAIQMNDAPEMERLIAAGADVNAVGKRKMTPLLWAFPDRKLERFARLLKHGADPDIAVESDFGTTGRAFHPYPAGGALFLDRGCSPGESVTHLAAKAPQIEYLKLVLQHGADPNVVDQVTGMTPLDIVIDRRLFDAKERVELLVASGADLNHYCKYKGGTPAMLAVQADKYDIALQLLRLGADPKLYRPDSTEKLTHYVVRKEHNLPVYRPAIAAEFHALTDWLEEDGESLEQARQDEQELKERIEKAVRIKDYPRIRQQIISEQKRRGRPQAATIGR